MRCTICWPRNFFRSWAARVAPYCASVCWPSARTRAARSEAVKRSSGQGNDRFGDPAHARLVEIDAADYDLTDTGRGRATLQCLIGGEACVDAAEGIGKSLQQGLQSADDLGEVH